jgi:hypothetical protein
MIKGLFCQLPIGAYGKLTLMRVFIIYHPNSEHSRSVEEYARDFTRQMSHDIELVSLESRNGAYMATLYDIVQYPAIIAVDSQSRLLKSWQGPALPLMNEVSYYTKD